MKIRTIDDLQDKIDAESSWRRKELSALKSNIETSRRFAKETALRAGITLLYAHWEGFVKNIATYYLTYVASIDIEYKKLKKNFLALTIKNELKTFDSTNKSSLHNLIVNKIFEKSEEKTKIPYENIIKTNSNLNSEIFIEIMETIGLDYSKYENNFKLLDEVLLKMRNEIAHGEHIEQLSLDEERFEEIYNIIIDMMSLFKNQVSNAAATKEYLLES